MTTPEKPEAKPPQEYGTVFDRSPNAPNGNTQEYVNVFDRSLNVYDQVVMDQDGRWRWRKEG